MLCGIAVPAVTYGDVWGMRSLPQIFFGMTHLATLLRSLGSAKLVRRSWICERTVILPRGHLVQLSASGMHRQKKDTSQGTPWEVVKTRIRRGTPLSKSFSSLAPRPTFRLL